MDQMDQQWDETGQERHGHDGADPATGVPTGQTPVPDAARPVHPDGEIDAPVAAADTAVDEGSAVRESPVDGLGAAPEGGAPVRHADSPSEGLGGPGAPVHGADSPAHGLGSADPTGHETPGTGTPVQAAGTPERGTGADDGAEDRDRR